MNNGYKDLIVWQKAKIFCVAIYRLSAKFPKSELYCLTSQIRRAVLSIPSNIAEGSRRGHSKEQIQFYTIAYGSGSEVETQLEIAKDLYPRLSNEIVILENQLEEIMKMLNRLIANKKENINNLLQTTNYKLQTNKGFTLIELVLVIGIVGILISSLAFYSRSAERQIILFRDQAKIVSALLKAKSLTIATYSEIDAPCGYGVHINQARKAIIIFKDLADDPRCVDLANPLSDADDIYSGDYTCDKMSDPECIEKLTLDKLIDFTALTTLNNIIYIPPDPYIILNGDDTIISNQTIEIQTFDGAVQKTITVTKNGQITTQ